MKLIILPIILCLNLFAQTKQCPVETSTILPEEVKEKIKLSNELKDKVYNDTETENLFKAIKLKDLEGVLNALKNGADPNAIKEKSRNITPASLAAGFGNAEILRAILDAGADPNKMDENLQFTTPMMQAAKWNQTWAIEILMEPKYKTNINQEAALGRTALHMAAYSKHFEALALLVKYPDINLNASSFAALGKGGTALSSMCFYSNSDGIKILLDHPVKTKPITLDNINSARKSIKGEKAEEIKKLLDQYKSKHYPEIK